LDYVLKTLNRTDIGYTDKCFLLWCWEHRGNDEIFYLGNKYGLSADLCKCFCTSTRTMDRVINRLKKLEIIIIRKGKLYLDFTK